ncbi:SDR family NAD(P)-dependent oxidoreductase [Fulvivirga sp. 29W222]|uniref:SDR family NAD(P)-dependent oxidoreductase n=1 Tax=Fulvivirga marina TaxID=2494733 RepID=A0A937G3Y2_9BACT|nr:SDR family NAD(P)-dependent oxidoreductase [Fulvivirga marina]MBL6449573.1 SDR family NAD(P)-dependent oxidoreductase [Fulvivirga marina]
MTDKEILLESTDSYLKNLISEVAQISIGDHDTSTPFQELGIDSFRVLQVIKKLEEEFGTLPKTLLFENFNIDDLSNYFVDKHAETLTKKFANGTPVSTPVEVEQKPAAKDEVTPERLTDDRIKESNKNPITVLEKEAYKYPELGKLVKDLFDEYKNEGSSSRGTRNIAPNLFIGSDQRGYFNYSRSKNIILVYTYTGPEDYFSTLAEEMYQYCSEHNFELNLFTSKEIDAIGGTPFSSTPFGVISRVNFEKFTLKGSKMRRLRYQVSKFEGEGKCRTEEYKNGTNKQTDQSIADIIDQWCAPRTMVNPLIHMVKDEILNGNLNSEHRLFLTYLDDVLQNVILISKLSSNENGYLMDLEFYPQEMPLGGLEYAIVNIVEILAAEGCSMLSLGGTYGCKLEASSNPDPALEKTLDYLREQNIFNDEGNLQFKNKFRPEHNTVFLCRALGSSADNVTDIIMMIADPMKMQTSDEENHTYGPSQRPAAIQEVKTEPTPKVAEPSATTKATQSEAKPGMMIAGVERSAKLADYGFNPLNIPDKQVEFDLKTDSWAQLELPAIQNQLSYLYTQLQQPISIEETLKSVFPFSHFALTTAGRTAEHAFCKAWEKKGVVLQNILFPTTIFHQIENGFTPKELPHSEVFNLNSEALYKGNLNWDALKKQVEEDPKSIAFVLIETDDNAAGGAPVSIDHIKQVKALLSEHAIPLVFDSTRIVENALFIIEHEKEYAGKNVWDVVREMASYADAMITSLAKDFCVNKGGLIATNDTDLFNRVQALIQDEGIGLDVIDKKVVALSFRNKNKIETRVQNRVQMVRSIWGALKQNGIPVVQPAVGHCILIDIKQIPQFKSFEHPVSSFISWLYLNTGIRGGAHNVGMQKGTTINNLVRLAIPVGLKQKEADEIKDRLIQAFSNMVNIPEVLPIGDQADNFGNIHVNFKLKLYHNTSGEVITKTSETASVSPAQANTEKQVEATGQHTKVMETGSNQDSQGNRPRTTGDIAIVGIAGRYPKAKNMDEFWENLIQGKDCIEDIPDARFEQRLRNKFSEKYRGGFIDGIDKFDSLFFNISPREAEYLDPQERLFLEVAWEALEDAGYYPETLTEDNAPRNIGVYVGAVWTLYQVLGTEEKLKGNFASPSSHLWGIANRVSYAFNLSGPSLPIDTACSSSLSALYLACEAIYKGECSSAIVGGVNLDVHQSKIDINKSGGALSADGVCRTFGKGANGYVAGEGVGAVLIKPLDQAEKDGDHIYGVIKGIAINHGGKTSGFMVPSPKSQAQVVSTALENGKVDARTIGYIEAHGTGTELGDPIEISGLTTAFQDYNVDKQGCSIGSVKTNIGHLEAAAGIVGLHKVLLQMKHRKLVPSLHSVELNPFIDFDNSPFYVEQGVEEWKPKVIDGIEYPLRAGISSFGAGGANAHVIIEEYKAPVSQPKDSPARPKDQIIPLSARNEGQLKQVALRLREFLEKDIASEAPLNLGDIAHTLRVGRKSFDHRLVIIAKTKEELIQKLTLFIDGRKDDSMITGEAKNSEGITRLLSRKEKEEFIKMLSQSGDMRKLAQLWNDGLLADWQGIQALESGIKVSLPTYPFADKRHWISDTSESPNLALQSTAALHPLIDSNVSTFERQIFKKTFHDEDFFIYDHLVSEIPTLPGVAYLDFARKAGELAAGRKVQKIKNILWLSPLTVVNSVPKDVFIELKPSGESIQFEVFSEEANGKQVYSQGKLIYATNKEIEAEPEYIEGFDEIKARFEKVTDGKEAYPLFKSLGLDLGPSFQVLQDIFKDNDEILGELQIPESRNSDFNDYLLHPSLVDGSFQAGMAAQLGAQTGEMFVPYSINEVEVLQPLKPKCYSYVRKVNEPNSKVSKVNVFIVDEDGMILTRIKESIGVPLVSVHEKPDQKGDDEEYAKLYYGHEWEETPLELEEVQADKLGAVLLFGADDKLRKAYKKRFKDTGEIILVQPGDAYADSGDQVYTVNPQNPDDFRQLFESLNKESIGKICFAWPVDTSVKETEYSIDFLGSALDKGVYAFLTLCQTLIAQKMDKVQLQYVYLGHPDTTQPHHEAINGFAKTLQLEQSKMQCKILEIQQSKVSYDKILDVILAEFDPSAKKAMTVRYEEGKRYVRKVKEFALHEAESSAPAHGLGLKEKGVYIITGGAGGLGLIFARYLADECKARLVLTGRSKLSDERKAELDELTKAGAEVVYMSADVSSYKDVERLIKETKAKFGAVNGIIHSAGVLRDSYVRNKTREEMEAVFAPKVFGTRHLDEATKGEDIDFFVTFSSLAAVGGNAGQCDYSFANHFMDSFAAKREFLFEQGERSGVTFSLNWSLWADGGMQLDEQTEIFFKKNLGIKPLSIETGLEAFEKGLHAGKNQFVVLEGVQEKIERTWGIKEVEEPEPVQADDTADTAGEASGDQQSDKEVFNLVQDALSELVMELLKVDAEDIELDKILLDLGFDSIGLTTYANRINEKYKLDVTPVLFFEYPSIKEIAGFISREHKAEVLSVHNVAGASASSNAGAAAPQTTPANNQSSDDDRVSFSINKGFDARAFDDQGVAQPAGKGLSTESRFIDQPIAIVGMSGVMPESKDLEEFWDNLENERNLITVIPRDRWNWEDYDGDPFKEKNKTNSKWGGFMKDVDKFDPLFFGISPREAEMMDPQQRIFLETVWKAIEDSGHKVSDLSGTKTGLFVGVATRDYADSLVDKHIPLDGYTASGNSHSVLVNRVSFLLNLRGPSAPLDTACSSSLIAVHRAIESIHTGSSDMAIVGGVQLMLTPAAYISFGMAGMLSGDGKCKSFDKSANGYVRGEGSGAIFLKPLDKAEADNDHIYAVIKATTENHGGRVTMLTAPNPVAQTDLLVEAYTKGQVDPSTIGFIECHGTGTSLGDPIEIQALNKTFSELYKRSNKVPGDKPHCGLTTVKTNIGHLETAAGVAGMLKVLLSLKHKKIPASLHFKELNPYINLKDSPLYIVDKTKDWEPFIDDQGNAIPRRAGVSSFGFGGANAHVVLEEYIPKEEQPRATYEGPYVVVLSAKNEDRLKAYAELLLEHVEKYDDNLTDLAFTLQVGRDEMVERLGLVVNSRDELKEKLSSYLNEEEKIEDVYFGRITQRSGSEFVEADANHDSAEALVSQCFTDKDYSKLAEAWVKGIEVDWYQLYKDGKPRRMSLPTYPFARERYWFNIENSEKPTLGEFEKLHPMLHYNSSVLSQQSYTSNFSDKEFFVSDYKLQDQNVMPLTAYLEMARVAVEKALPDTDNTGLELYSTSWGQLLEIPESKKVNIALFENDNEEIDYEIYSMEGEEEIIHCRGRVAYSNGPAPVQLDIEHLKTHFDAEPKDHEMLYQSLEQMGMNYGPTLKSISELYQGDGQILARLILPEAVESNHEDFGLHPSMMESALQLATSLLTGISPQSDQPVLPFEVGALRLIDPCQKEMYAWVRYSKGSKPGDRILKVDIDLTDETGKVCIKIKSLAFDNALNRAVIDTSKDFEMLLNVMHDQDPNGKEYAESEDSEISFDKLLKDLY